MIFTQSLTKLATDIVQKAHQAGYKITTAESCTGGLIAALLTQIPGSSSVFEQGFVTYSNASKNTLLGVCEELLQTQGAVSESVAKAMASGALQVSSAQFSISVTGIAGPGGATPTKPVGLVYIAIGQRLDKTAQTITCQRFDFGDLGRSQVRLATVQNGLEMLEKQMLISRNKAS